jgi:hypothetical protein
MSSGGQVTGGSVKFMERVKTGDYEHKEVSAELNFSVADGHDYRDLFDRAADDAREQVVRLLGKPKGSPGAKRHTGPLVRAPEIFPTVSSAAAEPDPLAGASITSGGTAVEQTDPLASSSVPNGGSSAGLAPQVTDPLAMPSATSGGGGETSSDPLAGGQSETLSDAKVGQTSDDPLAGDEWVAARQYTDKELMDEITRHNGRLIGTRAEEKKNEAPLLVRGVIAKYVAVGKPPREIPMEHRARFVGDLEALK